MKPRNARATAASHSAAAVSRPKRSDPTREGWATASLLLTRCSGGDSSSEDTSSGERPACSDFANGEEITEELSLAGCEGVTTTESIRCGDSYQAIAVGPVYGFVGKPANYLGDGAAATSHA